jgi:hypothetical protein
MQLATFGTGELGGRERHPIDLPPVEADLEPVVAGTGQWQVEHQHRPGLDIGHARRRFPELDGALAFDQRGSLFVDETDPHRVLTDLGPPAAHPEHQMGAWMDRRKCRHPDVLKQPQDRQLALLVDEGVVGEDGEVEDQIRPRGSK